MDHERQQRWKKIFLLIPLFVLFSFGYNLSAATGNVLFVERIGSEFLPLTYVVQAFFGAFLAIFTALLLKKVSSANLLQIYSWLGAGLFFGLFWLMRAGFSEAYIAFAIMGGAFYLILSGTVIWSLAAELCTLFESKKLFNYFLLAASAGGIFAGLTLGVGGAETNLENLVPLLSVSLVLASINLILIQLVFSKKLQPVSENESETKESEGLSRFAALKKEFAHFRKYRLGKLLFIVLTIFNVVWWVSDFEFQKIVGDALSEEKFAQVTGTLTIFSNIAMLLLVLFFQEWIIKKAGILNAIVLCSVLVLGQLLVLFISPLPIVAMVVNFVIPLVGNSIFSNSSRFVFTALPHAIRNKLTTFVSGNSDALAMLLAGGGLMLLNPFLPNLWIIGLACALMIPQIITVFLLKKEYVKQVERNLESGDSLDIHSAIENLAEPTYRKEGVQDLMKLIHWRKLDTETVRKIIIALGKINNIEVIPSLIEMLSKYDSKMKTSIIETIHGFPDLNARLQDHPFTRLNILETYEKIFLDVEDVELKLLILDNMHDFDSDKVIVFLRNAIKDPHPELHEKAIAAMRTFHDRGIIPYIKPYLQDSNLSTKAAALIALWQFAELKQLLLTEFVGLMARNSKEHVLAALKVIGTLGFTWELRYVQKHLDDSDQEVQAWCVLTLVQLNDKKGFQSFLHSLTNQTSNSAFFAKSLKQIPKAVKTVILRQIQGAGERATQVCVEILTATELQFDEEIETLTQAPVAPLSGFH